ncbi:MAG: DNA repair protein RecN [Aliishimia sp.]
MLRGLEIRDMLIIDRLELEFQPGLNVLTGETGAGKSILLDSLGFVLGWRGRADLVRQGADSGEVTAWFDLAEDHPAQAVLEEAGLSRSDELILRRVNRADGRKTAWINDRRASGDALRALSDVLVELHGQHDDRGLLNPRGHRTILDTFGGLTSAIEATRKAWTNRRVAESALHAAQKALESVRAEEEFLRHAVAELDAMSPEPGEDAQLDSQRRAMQGAEKIATDVTRAHVAMGYDGAEGAMSDALRWLEDAADKAEGLLDEPMASLLRAMSELADAANGVESCMDALKFDPSELENTEERLFALRGLARKYDVAPDELAALAEQLRTKLTALDAGDADLARLESELSVAQGRYDKAADTLHDKRVTAAKKLDKAVSAELAPLKMDRAVFETQITEEPAGPLGRDTVAFTVATNPGAPAGPLNKIASGGELSRFLLALKVCLTQDQKGLTMIFDEIDRGVGGATADAVGRRLSALASDGQVLVVTHSPQVAALGAHHWRVEKRVDKGMTTSTVVPLEETARVDEIARMISGDRITEEARAASRTLLSG